MGTIEHVSAAVGPLGPRGGRSRWFLAASAALALGACLPVADDAADNVADGGPSPGPTVDASAPVADDGGVPDGGESDAAACPTEGCAVDAGEAQDAGSLRGAHVAGTWCGVASDEYLEVAIDGGIRSWSLAGGMWIGRWWVVPGDAIQIAWDAHIRPDNDGARVDTGGVVGVVRGGDVLALGPHVYEACDGPRAMPAADGGVP